MLKTERPCIPKITIEKVGSFDEKDRPVDWVFNGGSHPNSVAEYISDDWHLVGGYTIAELLEIKELSK